jgi:PTH1 family peptidyl-tRNA hydrolase
MKLFLGLGNPDSKYQATRHNLGQMVLRQLVNLPLVKKNKLSAQLIEQNHNLFVVSTEYMNNSGLTAQKILNFYKIQPSDLYVIHDDLDLPIGEYRFQFDRGPAGHKGIESIIEHLGTQAFNRIRIGIGHPIDSTPVESYVLMPFSPEEKVLISATIAKIIPELQKLATGS